MTTLMLGVGEPFSSPPFNSNFVVFSSATGAAVPEQDTQDYIKRACRYARQFGVYLVPERFVLMGYQSMCLISPEGRALGVQKALHLRPGGDGQKQSVVLEIISTEFGGIFLCVDSDIYHPQVARIAHSLGAHILIASQQLAQGEHNNRRVLSGVWSAAQGNALYAVGVCNKFNCVSAPRALTQRNDGFVVPPNLKMPMTAEIAAEELHRVPPRPALNRRFYEVHRQDLTGQSGYEELQKDEQRPE
jgi:Predicted amidohydrolase